MAKKLTNKNIIEHLSNETNGYVIDKYIAKLPAEVKKRIVKEITKELYIAYIDEMSLGADKCKDNYNDPDHYADFLETLGISEVPE